MQPKRVIQLVVLVLFAVLAVGCSTTTEAIYSEPYSVVSEEHEDIRGNFTLDRFVLHKDMRFASSFVVFLDRFTPQDGGSKQFNLSLYYAGTDWRFIDTILVKTDSELFELTDPNPERNVRGANSVNEAVSVSFPAGFRQALLNTQSLEIQYDRGPQQVDPEGLEVLKAFLTGA